MKNYTVKYTGGEAYKVFSKGNVSMDFNKKNGYVLDIEEELKEKANLKHGREFDYALKKWYSYLIESCDCIPYLTIESAKHALIDIRNDCELIELRANLMREIEAIQAEMNKKVEAKRHSQDGEGRRLKHKLETEINLAMNEADTDRARWKDTKDLLDQEEGEINKLEMEDKLKHQYQEIQLKEGKWNRLKSTMNRGLADLEEKQSKELQAIRVLYNNSVAEKKQELNRRIRELSDKMTRDRVKELIKIQDIVDRVQPDPIVKITEKPKPIKKEASKK